MQVYLNCSDNEITYNKKNYLLRAQERMGLNVFIDLKNREGDAPTDYVLNIEPCVFAKGNKWTGFWHIDTMLDNNYANMYGEVDTVFVAGSQLKIPTPTTTQLLFQAADPALHRRNPEIAPYFDFVLAGSMDEPMHSERVRQVELLKPHFTYTDYGKDHKPEEYVSFLNKAKVQFIRSMGARGEGELAQRFFECMAIGPVLTNYVSDLDQTGYIEGVDYLSYKTDWEMLGKMEMLINDKELRNKIATSGRNKTLLYHTYEARVASIIAWIQNFQ